MIPVLILRNLLNFPKTEPTQETTPRKAARARRFFRSVSARQRLLLAGPARCFYNFSNARKKRAKVFTAWSADLLTYSCLLVRAHMDRTLRTGDGRPRVGMATHTWGWTPARGGGHSHLGMAGLRVGMAKKTDEKKTRWGGVLAIASRHVSVAVAFPSNFEKRKFCHSRHQRWGQVSRRIVVGDAVSLAPPCAGTSVPMRFAPPRPCETSPRPRRSDAADCLRPCR